MLTHRKVPGRIRGRDDGKFYQAVSVEEPQDNNHALCTYGHRGTVPSKVRSNCMVVGGTSSTHKTTYASVSREDDISLALDPTHGERLRLWKVMQNFLHEPISPSNHDFFRSCSQDLFV